MRTQHLDPDQLQHYDDLEGADRAFVQEHVLACASCRAEWLAVDASRLFGLLAAAPISAARLNDLAARVGQQIDNLRPATGRRFAVASMAASVLLAMLLGGALLRQPLAERSIVTVPLTSEEAAGIRLVSTPGGDAQVLDFKIGETQLLMIFDEAIDL